MPALCTSVMWRDGANIRVGRQSQMILRAPTAASLKRTTQQVSFFKDFTYVGTHHGHRWANVFGSHMISRTISWTPPTRNDFATSRAEHEKVYFYHDLCDY